MLRPNFLIRSLVALLPTLLASCDGDTYRAPTQQLDLVEFVSDADGLAHKMVLDNGDTLLLSHPEGGFLCDTVCRCMAVFRPYGETGSNTVEVTSFGQIVTTPPLNYNVVVVDPVDVTSVWTGGNYLNLRLSLRTRGSAHALGFAELGYTTSNDGSRTLNLMLYNNSGNDAAYFSRTVYVSCALGNVLRFLKRGRDSVAISINEYDNGFVTYRLPLPANEE